MWRVLRTVTILPVAFFVLSSAQGVVSSAQEAPTLPWMNPSLTPQQRADLLIPQMTLAQKVQQLSNDVRPLLDPENRPPDCEFERVARYIHGIPELGIPSVRMTNGGTGLRGGACLPQPEATAVPSASAIGASFSRDMARQLGDVLGNEARLWGHQVLLGPLMNFVRHPYGGRNFDFPGEDPYLTGVMSVETIKGIQAHGVHSVPKHIVGNEQETDRNNGNSVIPPRALHEIYLLPFEMSAKDGEMAGVMCAYNRVNGISACSDRELLTTTMREQWGWQGYVVTDRRALHDLAPSIKAGVDWELAHETPHYYQLEPAEANSRQGPSEGIRAALQNGSITVADIDQMLRRRYIQMFKYGQFETNFDATYLAEPDFNANGLIAREIAEQAIVLLKNQNNFLPLNATNLSSVALIGATWFAGMAKMAPLSLNADNANVDAPYTVTPQQGLENVLRSLGSAATVTYESGAGRGTQAGINRAVDLARRSDVVIVMVGDNPYESCDVLPGLPIVPPADKNVCVSGEGALPDEVDGSTTGDSEEGTDQEALMQALTADPAIAQKMVVVLKTQGSVLMPWLDRIPALVEAWYPGQEDGNAVANVLFGLRNPSGKLPMTFGTSEREAAYSTPEQFPGLLEPGPPWSPDPVHTPHYTEDLQMGYRWYEANGVVPLFPFGFGLSYTTFAYSGLSVIPTADPQTGRPVVAVTYTITNIGGRQGAEASQVYVTLPPAAGQPSKRLVGFQKVDLMPGESRQVTVTIDPSASNHPLSFWVPQNIAPVPGWSQGTWSTTPGNYTFHVGGSSADTPLAQTIGLSPVDTSGPVGGPSAGCTTASPGAGWVCVNGGWLPPGHPGIIGAGPTPNPPTGPTTPGSCTTVSPGAGWVCVNGGWLPPGHPGITGTPGPSTPPTGPTTPASCATASPGAGWVCVNGGWLPPGHPGIGGTPAPTPTPPTGPTTPAGCTTASPGAGWVCVNGGWLPPGHPGIGAGSTPNPPTGPTTPASCTTASPGAGWVCVNGGWLPPGHPGTSGAPPPTPSPPVTPTPTPASCTTPSPGAGWVCVNGGWLPPGHPLAGGTATQPPPAPASCETPPPVSDWVCVNGGWVPPDNARDLDDDGPVVACPTLPPAADWVCVNGGWLPPPPPATQPPAICTTAAPAAGWVCVNGGWLPPGHPAIPGLGGLPIPVPPANCPTAQPGAGWICVNGGWLPPGHPLANGAAVSPSTGLPLLTIDSAHVARVRDSLRRGEAQFQRGQIALEADATRALNVAPFSVMDKGVTPPSGDKHDYMSQAPYYWPDPSEPDGLPYIRRDGQRNPEIERITDRENLERLERTVTALGLSYYLTGRENYAQHAAQLLRVWFLDTATRMNPNLQFGQGIPGRAEGRSAGIIETRFLAPIIDAVTLLRGTPAWNASDDQGLKNWMGEYMTWLLESRFGREQARRGNNQETWSDVQIVALALYTGQPEIARRILEDAKQDIAEEFEPDGRQPRELARTRSWDYSIFDLTAFLHLAEFGERVGVDLWNYRTADGRSIRQGLEYLIPFATGERRWPHEQVTTFRPSALHPVLRRAAVGLNEPRYREIAREIGGESARLLLTQP